jgi:hypothetical protein
MGQLTNLFGRYLADASQRDRRALPTPRFSLALIHVYNSAGGSSKQAMPLVLPNAQSVQAFVFGLDNDSGSNEHATPSDLVYEDVDLEGDEKRQSMYVELLDGT